MSSFTTDSIFFGNTHTPLNTRTHPIPRKSRFIQSAIGRIKPPTLYPTQETKLAFLLHSYRLRPFVGIWNTDIPRWTVVALVTGAGARAGCCGKSRL